jgi:phosphoribosylcarboxyaminoimidazole (NCAIR) mutase
MANASTMSLPFIHAQTILTKPPNAVPMMIIRISDSSDNAGLFVLFFIALHNESNPTRVLLQGA